MDTKICSKCKRELLVSEFYRFKNYRYQAWCKSCKRKYRGVYSKTASAIESRRKSYERLRDSGYFRGYFKKQGKMLKLKMVAWQCVSRMKTNGEIQQQPCMKCGKQYGEAHHPDYNQPLLLIWLCHKCHMALHYNT